MIEFRILGPLEAVQDGRPLPLGHGKQRDLLAVLILHANEVVPSDRLIDELWGDDPPETAHSALRNLVSQLRRILASDGLIVTRPPGYELKIDRERLDLHRFEQLLADGREALDAGEASRAAALLRDACALWTGRPMEGVALDSLSGELGRLEALRLQATEKRIEADVARGRHEDVIPELETLVAEVPLRERLRELLMLALYRAGRQADALEVYRATRRALVEELGIEPGSRLQELERGILTQDPSLGAPEPSPARRSRTWAPFAGLAVLLLAAIVTAALLLREDDAVVVVSPNSIAVIDPETNRVVESIAVGRAPVAVTFGEGAVWTANAEDQTVTRIDPATRRVTHTIGLGAPPSGLAAAQGAVWITTGSAGTLVRVDPKSGTVVETFDFGGSRLAPNPTFAVAAGFGDIWVGSGARAVLRVDPENGRVVARITTPRSPVGLAAGSDAVWAVLADGTVLRIDPESGTVTHDLPTGTDPFALSATDESIWLSNAGFSADDTTLWRIDQASGVATTAIPLREPRGVSGGAEAVWVANGPMGTVSRIDPASNRIVEAIHVGDMTFDVTFALGMVWVSVLDRRADVSY